VGSSLRLALLVIACLALLWGGCRRQDETLAAAPRVAIGEQIVVSDSEGDFALEYLGGGKAAFHDGGVISRCSLASDTLGSWSDIQAAAEGGELRIGSFVAIDPNLSWHAVTVLTARMASSGEFVMQYVQGDDVTLRAARSVDRLLEACGKARRVALRIVVRDE